MSKSWLFACAAFVATGLGLSSASAANLVVNGDFSDPNVGAGWSIFPNGAVPGWTSNNNEIEIDNQLITMPSYYNGVPGQSLELNSIMPDAISQTITGLTVGQQYVLSWGYGDRPLEGAQYLANVYFGGDLVATNTGTGSGNWTSNTYIVTATADSETLTFEGVEVGGTNLSYGNEIADVSLSAAPEPATWAVFLIGFGGLGFMVRGLRRNGAAATA
jgi:hypothetical protein